MSTPSMAPSGITPPPTTIDMRVEGKDLLISFGIYGGIGFLVLLLYFFVRRRFIFVYYPRKLQEPNSFPPMPPRSFCTWFFPLFSKSRDTDILHYVGLDAYLTIRFAFLCFKLFLFVSFVGLIFLIPIYVSQGNEANLSSYVVTNATYTIERLTLVYMVGQDNRLLLLIPFFVVFVYTAVGIYLLHYEYIRFVLLKRQFYAEKYASTYTILVERIPRNLCSEKALHRYFETIFPGEVEKIDLIPDDEVLSNLKEAIEERDEVITKLERAMLVSRLDGETPSMIVFPKSQSWMSLRVLCYGCLCNSCCRKGSRVESIPHLQARLSELNEEVTSYQTELRETLRNLDSTYPYSVSNSNSIHLGDSQSSTVEPSENWQFSMSDADRVDEALYLLGDNEHHEFEKDSTISGAFITFKNKTASVAVSKSMQTNDPQFLVSPAPEPSDLIWSQLGKHPLALLFRRFVIVLVLIVLLVLFGLLTSVIAVSTNIYHMRSTWSALDNFLASHPFMTTLCSYISPLLLVILFALVPPIIVLFLEQRGLNAESATENSFFIHYFVFLVIQMFLFYQISGAIFTVVTSSLNNPSEVMEMLATMIPANAGFFMEYAIIRIFWLLPVELIRLGDLAVAFLVRPFFFGFSKTPREKRARPCACRTIGVAGDAWHGLRNAINGMMLAIGISYSVVTPLLCVFMAIYFGGFIVVYRNQLLYVYVKNFESGASNWNNIAIAYLLSFLLLHILMMGIFGLYKQAVMSALMLIPFSLTICYAVFMSQLTEHGAYNVSLPDARKFDIRRMRHNRKLVTDNYMHPFLRQASEMEPANIETMCKELKDMKYGDDGMHIITNEDDHVSSYHSQIVSTDQIEG